VAIRNHATSTARNSTIGNSNPEHAHPRLALDQVSAELRVEPVEVLDFTPRGQKLPLEQSPTSVALAPGDRATEGHAGEGDCGEAKGDEEDAHDAVPFRSASPAGVVPLLDARYATRFTAAGCAALNKFAHDWRCFGKKPGAATVATPLNARRAEQ
jgi:hypothetical protein